MTNRPELAHQRRFGLREFRQSAPPATTRAAAASLPKFGTITTHSCDSDEATNFKPAAQPEFGALTGGRTLQLRHQRSVNHQEIS